MKAREIQSALLTLLAEHGIAGAVEPGRKHPKLVFTHGGRRHVLPVASSPSDVRAIPNAKAQLRRILEGRR